MATYLVTGAAGFIGQHLTAALIARGERVYAVDVELHEEALEQARRLREVGADYHRVDLTDPARVAELPDVDGVFHLAALNGTQNFYSSPWQTLKHSTLPTLLLLERYAGAELEFFFYAGSSESYASVVSQFDWEIPTGEDVPLGISDPRELRWSYGASKLHGEVAMFAAAAELGVPAVVGRFHNAYGPHMGTKHVIPDFIARGREGTFSLYGSRQTRSFIYIDDAVRAVLAVAAGGVGEVINIGSPNEVTMLELAKVIMAEAGWSGEITEHPAPSSSVQRRSPDVTRLGELIDTSTFVPLEVGVREVLRSLGLARAAGDH